MRKAPFFLPERKPKEREGYRCAHVCTNAINMNPICISLLSAALSPLSITITPFVIDPIEQPQKPKLLLLQRHNPLAADGRAADISDDECSEWCIVIEY